MGLYQLQSLHTPEQSFLGTWVCLQTLTPSTRLKLPLQRQPEAIGGGGVPRHYVESVVSGNASFTISVWPWASHSISLSL